MSSPVPRTPAEARSWRYHEALAHQGGAHGLLLAVADLLDDMPTVPPALSAMLHLAGQSLTEASEIVQDLERTDRDTP